MDWSFNKIPAIAFGALIFVLTAIFCFFGVNIDLLLNPWVKGLPLEWWNFFTTQHYFTWLYSENFMIWLALTIFISVILALILTLIKKQFFKA